MLYGITPNFKSYIDYPRAKPIGSPRTCKLVPLEVANAAIRRRAGRDEQLLRRRRAVLRKVPGVRGAPSGFSPLKMRNWFLTPAGRDLEKGRTAIRPTTTTSCCARNGVVAGYGADGQLHAMK